MRRNGPVEIYQEMRAERDVLKAWNVRLREEIAFLKRFADVPDMKTGKTTRDELLEKIALLKGQLPPLTDAMYHAVRGLELEFTSGGPDAVRGSIDDGTLEWIWEAINTALRVSHE